MGWLVGVRVDLLLAAHSHGRLNVTVWLAILSPLKQKREDRKAPSDPACLHCSPSARGDQTPEEAIISCEGIAPVTTAY